MIVPKVGMKVKIKKNLIDLLTSEGDTYSGVFVTPNMHIMNKDKIYTISSVSYYNDTAPRFRLEEDVSKWAWTFEIMRPYNFKNKVGGELL